MITGGLGVLVLCLALALYDERRRAVEIVTRVTLQYEQELERALLERDGEAMYRRDAENRLLHAWKDGHIIPASDVPFVAPEDETTLDPILVDWLSDYDGEARAKYERIIRSKISRMTPLAILKEFENARGEPRGE